MSSRICEISLSSSFLQDRFFFTLCFLWRILSRNISLYIQGRNLYAPPFTRTTFFQIGPKFSHNSPPLPPQNGKCFHNDRCGSHKMSKAKPGEDRAVFVDEISCIGCKNCIYIAAATFRMEPDYGRSRVFAQWLNTEDEVQDAMDSCPVSCTSIAFPPPFSWAQNLTKIDQFWSQLGQFWGKTAFSMFHIYRERAYERNNPYLCIYTIKKIELKNPPSKKTTWSKILTKSSKFANCVKFPKNWTQVSTG